MKEDLEDTDSKCNLLQGEESVELQTNFITLLFEGNDVLVYYEISDDEPIEQIFKDDEEEDGDDDNSSGYQSELETSQYDNFWEIKNLEPLQIIFW